MLALLIAELTCALASLLALLSRLLSELSTVALTRSSLLLAALSRMLDSEDVILADADERLPEIEVKLALRSVAVSVPLFVTAVGFVPLVWAVVVEMEVRRVSKARLSWNCIFACEKVKYSNFGMGQKRSDQGCA